MQYRFLNLSIVLAAASFALPALANVDGANPRLTAAPGEVATSCTSCHGGTALNGGSGSIRIILPGEASYTPGVAQRIQVQVADASQRRWGFQLTARVASSPSDTQAGDLATVDSNAQIICANGRAKPCSTSSPLQFATHTLTGTRLGTTGGATFEVDWTPPATDVGNITFYAAGNAANGNNSDSGDRIYTTSLVLTPAASSAPKPRITSQTGVVNGASFQPGLAPGTWVTIRGTNLASSTRAWTGSDFNGNALPTSLDGVSVTINNQSAYVAYISPTQINVLSPDDTSSGPVEVRVTSNGQTSDPVAATLAPISPAFFTFDGKYLAATHADSSLLGKPGLFSDSPALTTPATPGETIVLYGTGFGATTPARDVTQLAAAIANIATPFTIAIGGVQAQVSFAGIVPPYAQLYQFNVQVPAGLAPGDHSVAVQMNGISSPSNDACCFLTVQ
jgi:uncharacterized protein (TIGR03437 family)